MILCSSKAVLARSESIRAGYWKPRQLVLRHTRCSAQNDAKEKDNVQKRKKFITRSEEPEEYWKSKGEMAGLNPLTDPIAIIGLIAIFAPFIILAVAVGLGYVDLTP